jgi:hypothetical protein
MSVNYTEKGLGMWLALEAAGLKMHNRDGVFYSNPANFADTSGDAALQAFINAYNPVPYAQEQKIAAINAECRARLLSRFGDPAEQVSRSIGVYGANEKAAIESGISATIDASNVASNAVLAATTVAAVEAVTVTWPAI